MGGYAGPMADDRSRRSGKGRSGSDGSGRPPKRSGSGGTGAGSDRSRAKKPRGGKGSGSDRQVSGTRGRTGGQGRRRDAKPTGRASQWGSLAQTGVRRESEPEAQASGPPRRPVTPEEAEKRAARAAKREARAVDQARLRDEAKDAVDRAESRKRPGRSTKRAAKRAPLPKVPLALDEPEVAITRLVGPESGPRHVRALREASQAFAQERFQDARRLLAPVVRGVPDVPEVAELQGLIQYRLGNWKAAADQLEHFRVLSGTTEQHPVLADCYRALERYPDVAELWDELRAASPSAALVTEGRIVAAGALADQGRLAEASALLEKGWTRPKRPHDHHLRRAYALADLYERSGRVPRAREVFRWIQATSPGFADVDARVRSL